MKQDIFMNKIYLERNEGSFTIFSTNYYILNYIY